jgi:uncharacterized delta-60 repeat protein
MATIIAKLSMIKALLIVGALFIGISSLAQPAGSIDLTFNPTDKGFGIGEGPNAQVISSAIQPDGKIIIGGDFTSYNGVARNRIARLNANGTIDVSFNPGTGANGSVEAMILQADGKIIISGSFTSYNGTNRNRIARLNTDGSLDLTFNPGSGANNSIQHVLLQNDGKIITGGSFTSYNGTTRNRLARLNADGTLDSSFDPGTSTDTGIEAMTLQGNGKIIIGGNFTSYTGTAINRIARLNENGSLDTSFNPGTGANNFVGTTVIQIDGKIIIGGLFSTYNGISRNRIARLNEDGSLDDSFNPGIGANNTVFHSLMQSDGKIIIAGYFSSFNGVVRNRIARLNEDGSLDVSFDPGTGTDRLIRVIKLDSEGNIIVGGSITSFNNSVWTRLIRITSTGAVDPTFGSPSQYGANDIINMTVNQPDGKLIIGGTFSAFNGGFKNTIARINENGSLDSTFDPGTGGTGGGPNTAMMLTSALQNDNKILIGGFFSSYNSTIINRIARLNADGSLDVSFNPGFGANNTVRTILVQSDGKIIIGGDFTSFNGTSINRIARLNEDGSLDTSFNPGIGANSNVSTSALQSDGKIIIGGDFTSFNGTPIDRIARLNADGSLDTSFNPGTGANSFVFTSALQNDGKIIIGGNFTSYNGTSINRIARLNTDGSLDTSFNPGTGPNSSVLTSILQSDGKIIIGGGFTTYNGASRNRIVRLNENGSLDNSFNPDTGADNTIRSVTLQDDQKLIIGGDFLSYNGVGRNRLARIILAEIPMSTADSLALVALYTSTNGANWTNKTNWLSGPVYTWHGVTASAGRVVQLNLSGNQLNGSIPAELGNLSALISLNLGTNSLSGTIPDEVGNLVNLIECRLNNNLLTGSIPVQFNLLSSLQSLRLERNFLSELPDLSSISGLTDFRVQFNRLTFEDLEPNASIPGIVYSPQDSLGTRQNVWLPIDSTFLFASIVAGGSANQYQWKKNDVAIPGATTPEYSISGADFSDSGEYRCEVTSALVPGLTIFSRPTQIEVNSFYRDSLALKALFTATDGANWNNKTNWESTPLGTGNWFGITVSGNRVTVVNLQQNNLVGEVPSDFTLAKDITSINLSDNKITTLPDLTQITALTALDVSRNELDFGSLEANASLISVNYVEQAPLAPALYLEIPVNSDYEMDFPVGGSNNVYQWKYNGQPIPGANTDTYIIPGINRSSMGNYVLEVANTLVPGLVLSSEVQRIMATATIAGTLFAEENVPATDGTMYLMRITTTGAYDSLRNQEVDNQGRYSFENVLLDDYVVNGFADTLVHSRALPTWFDLTIFWEEADTIFLNDNIIGLDIISELKPDPSNGDGSIVGTFFADFPGGRTDGSDVRGRVRKAGVAVRRVERIGRGQEDVLTLVAYVFTNDEGEFTIPDLPTGSLPDGVDYRINIQYPGYPMDTTSFVTIRLLPTLFDRQVGVEADVINGKIVVRKLIITGWEEEDHKMHAYPNPSVEYLYITPSAQGESNTTFRIVDTTGKYVDIPTRWDGENNRWELGVKELSPGSYILTVVQNGSTKTLRILIQ